MKLFNHHYLPLVSRMPSPLSSSQCLQPLGTYQTNPFAICSFTAVPTYKLHTAGSSPQIHCVSKSRPIGFLNTSRCNHWLIIKWLTTKYNNIPNFLNNLNKHLVNTTLYMIIPHLIVFCSDYKFIPGIFLAPWL